MTLPPRLIGISEFMDLTRRHGFPFSTDRTPLRGIRFVLPTIWMLFSSLFFSGCDSNPVNSRGQALSGDFCYAHWTNGRWQIYLNDVSGKGSVNISQYDRDDEYPAWSPDGQHIVFQRSASIFGPFLFAYDLKSNSHINLTADGGLSSALPQWTSTGLAVCVYQRPVGSPVAVYLVDPDSIEKKSKVLDGAASTVYMYPDQRTFIYVQERKAYKKSLQDSSGYVVFDPDAIFGRYIAVQGFNPATEELLIGYYPHADSVETIGAFSIRTQTARVLLESEPGYKFHQLVFSEDCEAIALIEHSDKDEYLSILKGGIKTRLVHIATKTETAYETFSFNPMRFSPDGRYLAFSKIVWHRSEWVSFTDHLYVVDTGTGIANYIGTGHHPSWRPGAFVDH